MTVRPAGPADAAALTALMRAFDAHLEAIEPSEHGVRSDADYARMAGVVTAPGGFARALLWGEPPAGFVAFAPIPWMDDGGLALWISDLYVAAPARGRGAGRALMVAARAEGAAIGARRLVWTVWRKNAAALDWYRRLGATEVAEELLLSAPV